MSEHRHDVEAGATARAPGRGAAVAALAVLVAIAVVGVVVWSQRGGAPAELPARAEPSGAASQAAPPEGGTSAAPGTVQRPRAATGAPTAAEPAAPASDGAPATAGAPAGAATASAPSAAASARAESGVTLAEVRAEARNAAAERAEAATRERSEAAVAAAMTAPPTDPLADVVAALGRGPHRWQWGTADPRADGPASRAWLADVQRAAGATWQPQASVALTGQALVLSNEAGVVGRLELVDSGVLWYAGAAPRLGWRAELPPDTVLRLRASLASWAAP